MNQIEEIKEYFKDYYKPRGLVFDYFQCLIAENERLEFGEELNETIIKVAKDKLKKLQRIVACAEEYLEVDSYGQNVAITDKARTKLQQAIKDTK